MEFNPIDLMIMKHARDRDRPKPLARWRHEASLRPPRCIISARMRVKGAARCAMVQPNSQLKLRAVTAIRSGIVGTSRRAAADEE